MLRIFKYLVLVASSIVLIAANSPYIASRLTFFTAYARSSGDLYPSVNLSKFRGLKEKCGDEFPNTNKEGGNNLFLLGDSFFEHIFSSGNNFKNVNNVQFVHWYNRIDIPELSRSSNNILIIETVERNLLWSREPGKIINIDKNLSTVKHSDHPYGRTWNDYVALFSEERLQKLLFFDPVSMYIKGIKADINRSMFHKTDPIVVIGPDDKQLFSQESFDETYIPVSAQKIDSIAMNYTELANYYKTMGFNEVYFVIAPNKESILRPDFKGKVYNHALERVRDNPNLKVPFIDMYTPLVAANAQRAVYTFNDTHWNCTGRAIFYNYVNEHILAKK